MYLTVRDVSEPGEELCRFGIEMRLGIQLVVAHSENLKVQNLSPFRACDDCESVIRDQPEVWESHTMGPMSYHLIKNAITVSAKLFGQCLLIVPILLVFRLPAHSVAQTPEGSPSPNPAAVPWGEAKAVSVVKPPSTPPAPILKPSDLDPRKSLRNARTMFVRSTSLLVNASTVEEKLRARSEFQLLGFLLTRDETSADLILELRHDLLTKYVYTAIDPRTQVVVATGKVSSLGGTVAGKVAKRFLKQAAAARTSPGSD